MVTQETSRPGSYLKDLWIRWIPHPLLTLLLVALWIALQNDFSPGNLVFAIVLGISIPIYTSHFWPDRPTIAKPWLATSFIAILLYDIAVANIHVGYLVLFKPSAKLRPGWISMPLDLRSPEAITALMATITLTPGTISSDISDDGRYLLIHCLDLDDADRIARQLKQRYEQRLKAIFP